MQSKFFFFFPWPGTIDNSLDHSCASLAADNKSGQKVLKRHTLPETIVYFYRNDSKRCEWDWRERPTGGCLGTRTEVKIWTK